MLDVGRHFLEIEQNDLTTLKKTTDNIKNLEKLIFTVSLLILRTSDETGGDINKYDIFIIFNKMCKCQYLSKLSEPIFPKRPKHEVWSHIKVKKPLKV